MHFFPTRGVNIQNISLVETNIKI